MILYKGEFRIAFNTINYYVLGIPAYFFCSVVGAVITICVYIMFIYDKKYELTESMKILFISLLGMAVGAKVFGFLTGVYRNIGLGNAITIETLLDTGIVYYGGLIGLITTYFLCLKKESCNIDKYALNVLAVCIPLFHFISRIGCFLSGCCYGKICKSIFSIEYTILIENYIDTNMRFPVQLLESVFEFGVFVYLFILLQKEDWKKKNLLVRYLSLYSVGRFFLEFLRGDIRRGIIYGISFSQCVSIIIWMMLIGYYLKILKKRGEI